MATGSSMLVVPCWLCRAARPHSPTATTCCIAARHARSPQHAPSTHEARLQVKEGQKWPQPLPLLWPLAARWHVQGKRCLVSEGLSVPSAPGGEAKCRARRRLVRGQPRAISSL